MPLIRIEFDDAVVEANDIKLLASAMRDIVIKATNIADVFVYANSAQIKLAVAPIEIFIEMSAHKIEQLDTLFAEVKSQISAWKVSSGFAYPINLTIIPMQWKFETGI